MIIHMWVDIGAVATSRLLGTQECVSLPQTEVSSQDMCLWSELTQEERGAGKMGTGCPSLEAAMPISSYSTVEP